MKTIIKQILAGAMVLLMILVLFIGLKPQSSDASIANMTAQLGVYNSTDGTYGLEVDNNNQFHFSQTGAGIYWPINTFSTETTLVANQTGQIFVSTAPFGTITTGSPTSGLGVVPIVLPTAVKGMSFDFYVATTEKIQLIPQGTDTLIFTGLTQGQSLYNSSAAIGDHIKVTAYAAGTWIVTSGGTWAHSDP